MTINTPLLYLLLTYGERLQPTSACRNLASASSSRKVREQTCQFLARNRRIYQTTGGVNAHNWVLKYQWAVQQIGQIDTRLEGSNGFSNETKNTVK